MTNYSSPAAFFILAGLLLGGCTDSGSSTEKESENEIASTATAVRTSGTQADSLGGIPGHKFGEPLSAFPGLELNPAQPTPGVQAYYYPDGKGEPGWFGKRKKEWGGEFYTLYKFKDGKFVAFTAIAYGDARKVLREQATYLFGPGKQYPTGTNWEGEQVLAYIAPQQGMKPAEVLEVQSQDFVKAQATAQADRLKKENAL